MNEEQMRGATTNPARMLSAIDQRVATAQRLPAWVFEFTVESGPGVVVMADTLLAASVEVVKVLDNEKAVIHCSRIVAAPVYPFCGGGR